MPSRSAFRRGRHLAALAAVLALAYVVYLGGANWFLGSSFADRVINDKPEKLRLEWSRARTWWPGWVVLDQVTIDGANRRFVWHARLDRVRVQLSLWGLPRKSFRTQQIVGNGLVFRLRTHEAQESAAAPAAPAAAETAPRSEVSPPSGAAPGGALASRAEPSRRRAGDGGPPQPRRRSRNPWELDFGGIRISDLREITVQEVTLLGSGELRGGLEHEIRGPLRFDELALSFAGARLLRAGQPVGEDVTFTIEVSSRAFEPGEDSVREILGGLSGDVVLGAEVESLTALNYLLRKPDWLGFSGSGRLDTAFRVRDGEVEPGGHLDFAASKLEARVLDWTADGEGAIALRLPESGTPAASLAVGFDQFAIRRGEREVAHVRGQDLRVVISARAIDLEKGFADLDLRVDVPTSRVDFVTYNSYLPASSMRIERGEGTIRSWFEYSEDRGMGRGEVEIEVLGAAGVVGDLGLDGDLKLHTLIRGGDFAARRFDVSGSSVELSNVRVTSPGGNVESDGWWAAIDTSTARLDMKEPLGAEIMVRGRLRDAKPFLTFLASRRKALFWLDELVRVKDLAGAALLGLDGQGLSARDLEITGNRLEIYGDLGYERGERDGLLYFKYGPFAAALEIVQGERDWKLFHPWRWFDDKRRARRSAPAGDSGR
ncbi:MAG TPA: hypothetical protein VMS86_13755 [Thermoanaerobaculia bacterium]|nr:hypothetical protein [Thermoanaerobaculia bacterium]